MPMYFDPPLVQKPELPDAREGWAGWRWCRLTEPPGAGAGGAGGREFGARGGAGRQA